MLKSIDVLIGVSVVMLIVSVMVTALTQAVLYALNARGNKLKEAVGDLLGQIAPDFSRECREHIAATVLLHPLVRASQGRLSSAIHREDLVKLLLELASTSKGEHVLQPQHRQSLLDVLQREGISDPASILENVRSLSLQLELNRPELSNAIRANIALLQEANSRFLGKVHAWFDQSIDRAIDRFTADTRKITFGCALIVAFALQLDTRDLVNRLSDDDALRARIVEQAIAMEAGPAPVPGNAQNFDAALDNLRKQQAKIDDIASSGAVDIPSTWAEWMAGWSPDTFFPHLLGILLTTVLLSFGAPFWYNALKSLLKLRSVVANRDDAQRQERQTLTTTAPVGARTGKSESDAVSTPDALQGERGYIASAG